MAQSQTHSPSLIVGFLRSVIRVYQWQSRLWGPHCRFYPSCSEYMRESLQTWGLWTGFARGTVRILKCHPWHPGGVDLVGVPHAK